MYHSSDPTSLDYNPKREALENVLANLPELIRSINTPARLERLVRAQLTSSALTRSMHARLPQDTCARVSHDQLDELQAPLRHLVPLAIEAGILANAGNDDMRHWLDIS